ncbi:cytochrome P450 [Podospora didyma]|uniref:Cytochrome P450 n=1 Tax=Podospora didyma TaxID=330526 RepID=A0AAE0KJM4_9PEZI|nr:cytochrome P450 [Podospora didyma]
MDMGVNSSSDASGMLLSPSQGSRHMSLLVGVGFCLLLASWHFMFKPSAGDGATKEPPVSSTSLPIFGHLLGFYRHNIGYLEILRRQTRWPAYTIQILNLKTYVVTTPALSHVALRSRMLSLEPLSAMVVTRMLGLSKEANGILGLDKRGNWVGSPVLSERRVEFSRLLAPGPSLTGPSEIASNTVAAAVNAFGTEWEKQDLFRWLRDVITSGTVMGLYGPKNPVALDPTLIEDIWIFDENQLAMTWGFLQSWIAPAGVRAVKRISDAFEAYVREGRYELASEAVKSTIAATRKLGLCDNDYARLEVFNISVATVNTVPTAVSMIYNILANPKLLAAVRDELQGVLTTLPVDGKTHGRKKQELDLSAADKTCPLLIACYQEALRIGSTPTCNRAVLNDTVLTDPETGHQIKVNKGQRVSIPTFMLHSRDQIWGGDATVFDPWRFLPGGSAADSKGRAREQGFVPYGGGVHLCPGRHLAKLEILASGALMIMALEFSAEREGDNIVAPAYAGGFIGEANDKKTLASKFVRIRRREGLEDVEWSVKI